MASYFNACDVTIANPNHNKFLQFFDVHLCPHFEKCSATHGYKVFHFLQILKFGFGK